MKKYSKAIFVTNYNQNNYLSDEDQKYLRIFPSNKSMELRQYAICESHLKAFLIPRNTISIRTKYSNATTTIRVTVGERRSKVCMTMDSTVVANKRCMTDFQNAS